MGLARSWTNLSLSKKLYVTVGMMAALIFGELLTLRLAMRTLSAARAFVGGEGLWSKAQKNATISLQRYGLTKDEDDFAAFLLALEVPEGDHQARMELGKPKPDYALIRQGFLRGRIEPGDIEPMIDLLERFAWTPYLSRAIVTWAKADDALVEFKEAALAYHQAVNAKDAAGEARALLAIKRLNEKLTAAEDEFSFVLGAGSRDLEWIVLYVLCVAVMIVESLGLTMAFKISRSISRGLGELTDVAAHIGRGDFSKVVEPRSEDEIGQLARSLGQMRALLQRSYSELEARVRERTQELTRSRNQLDIILRGITDGIAVLDDQGRFVYVNEVGARMCGAASVEELLRTPQSELFRNLEIHDALGNRLSPEQLPPRLAFNGVSEPPEVIVRFRLPGGEERWSIVKSAPIFDESRMARLVVTIFKDFTEHKRSEEGLKFLDEASTILNASLEYEATLQTLAQMLVPRVADWCSVDIFDGGRLQTVALAHVDPAKVKLAQELQARWPSDPNAPAGVARVLRTGKSELYTDVPDELLVLGSRDEEHLRAARALHLRSAIVVPLTARQRVIGGITIIWSDSPRRYSAQDLPLMEELGRRAGMAVDNARLYRQAQQAISVRDDFLAIAGHELKTPLAALLMTVQSTARALRKDPTLDIGDRLERAVRSGFRLERLINQLLDVSKIASGKLGLELERCDFALLIGEVVARFVEEDPDNRQLISVRLERELLGSWDRFRIDQVISNLVGNALKYGQGKPIEVALTAEAGSAVLRVSDRGIGIDREHQARIFERFERAVDARAFGGFGLGLWITRQIVEASGGTIAVESEANRGTTFTVRLPLEVKEELHAAP